MTGLEPDRRVWLLAGGHLQRDVVVFVEGPFEAEAVGMGTGGLQQLISLHGSLAASLEIRFVRE